MRRKRAARKCWNTTAPKSALVKQDYKSIAQLRQERERRDNFERGSRWAGIAMVVMFLFLGFGAVMFGW